MAGVELDWAQIAAFLDPQAFLMAIAGVLVGLVMGSIPGITVTLAMALALPLTIYLSPVAGLGLLIGIYKGGAFGGAISAIIFNIPGAPSSTPATFDGYPMTRQGRPMKALKTALWSSVSADSISDVILILTFAPLAMVALRFGPSEMLGLLIVAMTLVGTLSNRSTGKAMIGVGAGLLLASIGRDPIGGVGRMDFGIASLREGVGLIPLLIGLFALSEMMIQFGKFFRREHSEFEEAVGAGRDVLRKRRDDDTLSFREWISYWRETLTGALMGTFVGALPGPGGILASFSSYGIASRFKKNRGRFGTGVPEGVAAAESGDSATSGATLIPLFGLGIPGSALAALLAAALMLQGITPGPSMVRQQPYIVYAFFVLLFVASLCNLILGRLFIPVFSWISRVPMKVLVPILTLVSVMGVYSIGNSRADVVKALLAGLLGMLFRRHGISLGVVILAYIVGPLIEANLRRGAVIAGGDVMFWFRSPLALSFYVTAIIFIVYIKTRGSDNAFTAPEDAQLARIQKQG